MLSPNFLSDLEGGGQFFLMVLLPDTISMVGMMIVLLTIVRTLMMITMTLMMMMVMTMKMLMMMVLEFLLMSSAEFSSSISLLRTSRHKTGSAVIIVTLGILMMVIMMY